MSLPPGALYHDGQVHLPCPVGGPWVRAMSNPPLQPRAPLLSKGQLSEGSDSADGETASLENGPHIRLQPSRERERRSQKVPSGTKWCFHLTPQLL